MNTVPISDSLKAKVKALDQELNRLFLRFTCFCQLFKDEGNVALLNKAAGTMFRVIQDSMLFDIVFAIMRLVDPAQSVGRDNLCFAATLEDVSDGLVRDQLASLVERIKAATPEMKKWRNKRAAHNDLAHHLKVNPLIIPYPAIETSLSLIADAMNVLNRHVSDTMVLYSNIIAQDDGTALLFYLKYGYECAQEDLKAGDHERRRRIRQRG